MFRETLMVLNRCRVPYVSRALSRFKSIPESGAPPKTWICSSHPKTCPPRLRCLKKQGFRCQVKDPVWLHKAHRHGFFIDLITGMSNAVITVDRSWIENSRPAMILDVRARVLAAEELLASKLFVVRRERFDGADIAHIIYASHGNLDWEPGPGVGRVSTGKFCCSPWCCIATFILPQPLRASLGMAATCWFVSPMS